MSKLETGTRPSSKCGLCRKAVEAGAGGQWPIFCVFQPEHSPNSPSYRCRDSSGFRVAVPVETRLAKASILCNGGSGERLAAAPQEVDASVRKKGACHACIAVFG